MPFSLGFWAAAGAGGGAGAGAYEQISTTLLTGNAASVTFSSIPSTYKHLQLRMTARADSTFDGSLEIWFRFNGVSTMTYASHFLRATESGVASGAYTGGYAEIRTNASSLITNFSGQQAGAFTPGIFDILDYTSTTNTKTLRGLHGYMGSGSFGKSVTLTSGLSNNLGAISSLYIAPQYGNFISGSRFTLYGIKG